MAVAKKTKPKHVAVKRTVTAPKKVGAKKASVPRKAPKVQKGTSNSTADLLVYSFTALSLVFLILATIKYS